MTQGDQVVLQDVKGRQGLLYCNWGQGGGEHLRVGGDLVREHGEKECHYLEELEGEQQQVARGGGPFPHLCVGEDSGQLLQLREGFCVGQHEQGTLLGRGDH